MAGIIDVKLRNFYSLDDTGCLFKVLFEHYSFTSFRISEFKYVPMYVRFIVDIAVTVFFLLGKLSHAYIAQPYILDLVLIIRLLLRWSLWTISLLVFESDLRCDPMRNIVPELTLAPVVLRGSVPRCGAECVTSRPARGDGPAARRRRGVL